MCLHEKRVPTTISRVCARLREYITPFGFVRIFHTGARHVYVRTARLSACSPGRPPSSLPLFLFPLTPLLSSAGASVAQLKYRHVRAHMCLHERAHVHMCPSAHQPAAGRQVADSSLAPPSLSCPLESTHARTCSSTIHRSHTRSHARSHARPLACPPTQPPLAYPLACTHRTHPPHAPTKDRTHATHVRTSVRTQSTHVHTHAHLHARTHPPHSRNARKARTHAKHARTRNTHALNKRTHARM